MKKARVLIDGLVFDAFEDRFAGPNGIRLADGRVFAETDVSWLPPFRIRSAFAIGLNYKTHADSLDFKLPAEPMAFYKAPNTFIGNRHATRRPADVSFMHYECELTIVIGKTARRVPEERAYEYIGGYTVCNDYAFRSYLRNYYRPNLKIKSRDCGTPIGPWFVDAADIADPMNLDLRCFVDGKQTMAGNTRDMIFSVPFLVSYFSRILTLQPGDVILTGCPEAKLDLPVGSEVVTEIDGVGRLSNFIAPDSEYPEPVPCALR
ncbi:MAG: fumarylacetoacetate hydrolase family protein [Deltaproteobacteria bacterium]|nr:fumarylacetoacetate hydrolase family protein [Deltaproteobacteria bacterium]